ncbi:MAG: DUF4339 domain-containing protein [Cyclobacteriaceae bacterium]|nr:DUF4339 domain-containing protein [Cyclobacteriaceae bacterium]
MERKYYIHNGINHQGPLTLDELKEIDITSNTLIWYLGLSEWTPVQRIPELHHLIKRVIPPVLGVDKDKQVQLYQLPIINKALSQVPEKKNHKRNSLVILLSFIGLVIIFSITFVFLKESFKSKNASIEKEENTKKENQRLVNKPLAAAENSGNVYALFPNGIKKQLTFNQTDSDPILLPDKEQIIFVRSEARRKVKELFFSNDEINYKVKKVMLVNVNDSRESVLTDQKLYEDGQDGTHEILKIDNPVLSLDKNYLMFVTEKYATGSELVMVNLKTGVWTELFTAEWFEQIDKEPYKGYFFAAQSIVGDKGRGIYYRLVDTTGQVIKEFSDKENLDKFKSTLN